MSSLILRHAKRWQQPNRMKLAEVGRELLSYFMDYRDSDIARLLKITSPTVSYRKKQALIQLKLLLEAKHYE